MLSLLDRVLCRLFNLQPEIFIIVLGVLIGCFGYFLFLQYLRLIIIVDQFLK